MNIDMQIYNIGVLGENTSVIGFSLNDTFQFSPAATLPALPYTPLADNNGITINLIFTIAFLCIFAFIRFQNKHILPHLISNLFQKKKTINSFAENLSSDLGFYIPGLVSSFAITSISATYIFNNRLISDTSISLFLILILYHIFIIALIRFIGWAFKSKYAAEECVTLVWNFNIILGIFLSPFTIGLFFLQDFTKYILVQILIIIFIILLITKIIRWLQILISYKVSILYMILYLCALEIAPLLILYKIITVLGNN